MKRLLLVILAIAIFASVSAARILPPDQVVLRMLSALKTRPDDAMAHITLDKEVASLVFAPEISKYHDIIWALVDRAGYSVEKPVIAGDEATVLVRLVTIDTIRIMPEIIAKVIPASVRSVMPGTRNQSDTAMNLPGSAARQVILEAIKNPDAPMIITPVGLRLRRSQNQWKVIIDQATVDTVLDAFTGNLRKTLGF